MRTVLIADNDKGVLEYLDAFISSLNYFVATATNAHDVFRLVKIVRPDMIIIADDLEGASVNGVCARLQQEVGSAVPLIVSTEDETMSPDASCSIVVKKPFSKQRLKNLVLNLAPQLFI